MNDDFQSNQIDEEYKKIQQIQERLDAIKKDKRELEKILEDIRISRDLPKINDNKKQLKSLLRHLKKCNKEALENFIEND